MTSSERNPRPWAKVLENWGFTKKSSIHCPGLDLKLDIRDDYSGLN